MSDSSKRTALSVHLVAYGKSVQGAPLLHIPPREECQVLIVAGIHGEEPETTVSLSRAVRSMPVDLIHPAIGLVFAANPDGLAHGTRGNANGVDLNRNFPTSNWQKEPVTCRWHADEDLHLPIETGPTPGSEPETSALGGLIQAIKPKQVLALHGPLACIDDPDRSRLAVELSKKTGLPLVEQIGYATPGSLGTWGEENHLSIVTWEFPPDGIETLSRTQVPVLVDLLKGNFSFQEEL